VYAFLSKPLDLLAIKMACRSVKPSRTPLSRQAAASTSLELDLGSDADLMPAEITFQTAEDFQFASPVRTAWETNNVARGKLFRCAENWAERPTVVLVHGWNAELSYRHLFPWFTRRLSKSGINTAMIELPYHGHRKPWCEGRGLNFISDDLSRTLQAARQAVADIRTLVIWLRSQGCRTVGLWGFSLGAWLSGVVTCAAAEHQFAVLTTPVVRIDRAIAELAFCRPVREAINRAAFPLDALNLACHRPKLSAEKILIVEAQNDLFAPAETIEELCQAWEQPNIWRVSEGHISVLISPRVLSRTVRWIAEKSAESSKANSTD
jgi:dienelactone hydrolase